MENIPNGTQITAPNYLAGIKQTNEILDPVVCNGIKSGYVTHDYNDNGLKMGNLTIVTGKTGSGKSQWVTQVVISALRQNVNTFMFVGETSLAKEKHKLVRLTAKPNEIVCNYGLAGVRLYSPCKEAVVRFDEMFQHLLYLTDVTSIRDSKLNPSLFGKVLIAMKNMAKDNKVKLFILDNLMVLCEKSGNAIFDEQKKITLSLKTFAEEAKVHVILVAHPKKGEGNQDISGATEIQNLSDTIVRYVRIGDAERASLIKVNPDKKDYYKRISATMITEKIRDDGQQRTAYFEWEPERGILFDLSEIKAAAEYEQQGWWTRAVNKQKIVDIYY